MTAGGGEAIAEPKERWTPKGAGCGTVFIIFRRAGTGALGKLGVTGAGGRALGPILGRVDTGVWLAFATLGTVGAGGGAITVTLGTGAGGRAKIVTLGATGATHTGVYISEAFAVRCGVGGPGWPGGGQSWLWLLL